MAFRNGAVSTSTRSGGRSSSAGSWRPRVASGSGAGRASSSGSPAPTAETTRSTWSTPTMGGAPCSACGQRCLPDRAASFAAVASVQLARPWRVVLSHRIAVPAFLIALTALSAVLRTRQLNGGFWIDEGLSVGIAHHHWSSIPGLLRQDGSPPGYYLLLGLWIR